MDRGSRRLGQLTGTVKRSRTERAAEVVVQSVDACHLGWPEAAANLKKHKVSFEVTTALADPPAITGADPDHSVDETRWITFGLSNRWRLLAVAHTDESDTIHIISYAPERPDRRSEDRMHRGAHDPDA
jgi:uncharacterized protein